MHRATPAMRDVKIVCTLGPTSADVQTIGGLVDAGMSVARLNASHGSPTDRKRLIETVKQVAGERGAPVATMVDLSGPEVRTAAIETPVQLEAGATVEFREGETVELPQIGVTHPLTAAAVGDRVLLADGQIETTVEEVTDAGVRATVDTGGTLGARKGVNVPGVDLDIELITPDDAADLAVAVEAEADLVAASFIRSAADIYEIRDAIEELGGAIPVIAKIERAGAVENLDAIIDAAFGVMVARGDLGVELPLEEVPMIQKDIIGRAQRAGTPVITATEMLDSMVRARRPTRAEASDVANAVLDGTDAVMLSAETAVGDDPVWVVETMDRIICEVEGSTAYAEMIDRRVPLAESGSRTEALARSARYLARDVGATAVIAASESGYTARRVAKFRPAVPVVAITPTAAVQRQLAISWGITPIVDRVADSIDRLIESTVATAVASDIAASGDTLVVLSGLMTELESTNTTNMLKLHIAAETLTTGRPVVGGRVAGPLVRLSGPDVGVPSGAIVAIEPSVEPAGLSQLEAAAGIIDAHATVTGYAAMTARELEIPMIADAPLDHSITDGTDLTLHGDRAVVYEGDLLARSTDTR